MTSVISRDDIEAASWMLAGRRVDAATISKFMRLVDRYARQLGRQFAAAEDLPEITGPQDPYPHLLPGKFDFDAGIGRCVGCDKVKRTSQFNKDSNSPWGRRSRCRLCQQDYLRAQPPVLQKCRQCLKPKNLYTDFYKNGAGVDGPDGFMSQCKDCKDGRVTCIVCHVRKWKEEFPDDGREICGVCRLGRKPEVAALLSKYKCRKCGERKFIDEFPSGKKDDPRGSYACLTCETPLLVAEPKGGYLCRVCHRRKPLELFPLAKSSKPAMMIPCLDCQKDREPYAV